MQFLYKIQWGFKALLNKFKPPTDFKKIQRVMLMGQGDYLNEKDLEKVKILQEKMKQSSCNEERKRLVTEKALMIEKARVKKKREFQGE